MQNKERMNQSLDSKQPYQFGIVGQDYEIDGVDDKRLTPENQRNMIGKVMELTKHFSPNKKYQNNVKKQFANQLKGMNFEQLRTLYDMTQILQKYQTNIGVHQSCTAIDQRRSSAPNTQYLTV